MDWLEIAKYAGAALGGGFVGSILTAWNGWGIEKRRLLRQQRSQLIADWRKMIASLPDLGGWSGGDPACRAIVRSEAFASLEPHLPRDLLDRLRKERNLNVGADFPRRKLSERVAELEKEWGLI